MRIRDVRGLADHIKSQVDLVRVMGKVLDLQRAGNDLYKALCCFHEEKTPSLTVTPSKGLYHCFGCKASGDVINFMKDYYHMDTLEAMKALAEEYDIDISKWEREPTPEEKEQERLMWVNSCVAKICRENVPSVAREFFERRGLQDEVLEEFQVGYSSHVSGLVAQFDPQDVATLELDKESMWDNAIVYPLFDPYGRIIGFKNRPLDRDRGPKFVATSSKSPLHRDDHVYGLHIARKHLDRGRVIVVEGQHDVLMAHQHGVKNVVGSDGTALNKEKLALLESFGVREVVVLFDGDDAGRQASYKLARDVAALETTIAIKIATLPEGHDPDTYLQEQGKVAFLKVVSEAVYASQYHIDRIAEQSSLSSVTGKLDFVKRVQPVVLKAPEFERAFLIAYVAEKIGVDKAVIEDMIREEEARRAKSLLYNIEGERIVLGAILRDEDYRVQALADFREDDWHLPKHRTLFGLIRDMADKNIPISIDTIKTEINNRGFKHIFDNGVYIDDLYATVGNHQVIGEDLLDKAARRRLIKEAEELQRSARDLQKRLVLVVEEHLDGVQKSVDATMGDSVVDGSQGAREFMDTLLERMANPGAIVGLDLGPRWRNVTSLLNGICPKKLITIAANQSVGKTTLLLNWLAEIAVRQGKPWLHFTLEMPEEEVVQKVIGILAEVDATKIATGNLSDEEFEKVKQAALAYHEGGLLINDKVSTLEGVMSLVRKYKRSHDIAGVSIDYVQLMSIERRHNKQRYEELGDISGGLKRDLANAMGLPVIILSQLNRGAKDKAVATAEDGAGAYKIAQDSDVYLILRERSEEQIERYGIERGNMDLFLDKNRGGKGDVLLDVFFDRNIQVLMEVDT